MFGKKDHVVAHKAVPHVGPHTAAFHHASSLTEASSQHHQLPACLLSPNKRSTQSRSHSKGRKMSAKKLFEKAHEIVEGETYLKEPRSQRSVEVGQTARSSPRGKNSPERAASLMLHKQYDIKVAGYSTDVESDLSKIIGQFGGENHLWTLNLSSIIEDGIEGSDIESSTSLLRAISTQ